MYEEMENVIRSGLRRIASKMTLDEIMRDKSGTMESMGNQLTEELRSEGIFGKVTVVRIG